MLCRTVAYCTVLCCAKLCHAMLNYVILCYDKICFVTLCYAMLCSAMLCFAMLCCAMPCYTMRRCYAMHVNMQLFSATPLPYYISDYFRRTAHYRSMHCLLCGIALQSCSMLCSIATDGPAKCTLCSIAFQSLVRSLLRNGISLRVMRRCFASLVLPMS